MTPTRFGGFTQRAKAMFEGGTMHILTLVLMAANVLALGAHAVLTYGASAEFMEQTVWFVVVPALVGWVGVARRSAWGRGLSALALAAQVVLFGIQLRQEWGHLHGGEWILVAWIALATVALLLALVTPDNR